MIDPHVHFRDWNQKYKETVAHGLETAKRLGFTHVFDMPNTDPALTNRETVIKRLKLAEESGVSGVSYHVWMGLTADEQQIREAVETVRELWPAVAGLKMFLGHSTGNMGICTEEEQEKVFQTLAGLEYTGVVAVHAEKEALMHPELYVPGQFETHSLARPPEAEIESVRDIIRIVKETEYRGILHIAHISTAGAIELVQKAKDAGMRITFGVTPHHALFNTEDAKDHARYLKMNPPLRNESDRKAVYASLFDGSAEWIESDHAPHTLEEKEAGASGIPGLENMILLMNRMREDGMDEERFRALTHENAYQVIRKS